MMFYRDMGYLVEYDGMGESVEINKLSIFYMYKCVCVYLKLIHSIQKPK